MRIMAAVCLAFALVGCGAVQRATQRATGDDTLFYASYQRIAVIDARSHLLRRSLNLGVPAPDWTHLYSAYGGSLIDTDPATGSTLGTMQLPARYQLPDRGVSGVPGGLSDNGKWLALEAWDTSTSPPSGTHLLVVPTLGGTPTGVDLQGWWQFDAISDDGQRLYLLEYLGSNAYRVRQYLVDQHRLDPQVIVDKTNPRESMAGVRLASVGSADGQFEYTIYARQNEGAFIHALRLDGTPISFCLDLPGPGYATTVDAFHWSLAMNADGTNLYAVNAAIGAAVKVAIGHDQPPTIERAVRFSPAKALSTLARDVQAKEFGANALVITPDGRTLIAGGNDGAVWLDASTLSVRRHELPGWTVWSLGISPDGARVYAVRDNGSIAELDATSGALLAEFNPGLEQPMALLRVA